MSVKSIVAERSSRSTVTRTSITAPRIRLVPAVVAVTEPVDDAPHLFLGVVLHVPHVRLHDVEVEVLDHPAHLEYAARVRGDLGAQVREVRVGIARRIQSGGEQLPRLVDTEVAVLDE